MTKIILQGGMCQGHARCHAVNSELFTLDDDGYSDIDVEEGKVVREGLESAARAGVASCPERALRIEELE